MKSITLYTEEIDDFEDAAAELKEQLDRFALLKNTVGIVFTNADNDIAELMESLNATFDFPMIGTTALAMLTGKEGYCDLGITILVMTADDCEFKIGMAEHICRENYEQAIGEAYTKAKAELNGEDKLIIAYGSMLPNCVGDDFLNAFDKVSNGVPVYGALCSDGFTYTDYAVFDNEHIDSAGIAFILISGNINPIFACEYSISNENAFQATVTKSEGNIVYELNKGKFVDVIKNEGLESGSENVIMEFVGSPFIATMAMKDGSKIRVMRFLTTLNQENRSGAYLGGVPEGTELGMSIINRSDVEKSIQECLNQVISKVEAADGYEYSTFLFNSCAGRYLLLTRDPEAEARAYQSVLPDNISAAGFYSYGEMAPVHNEDNTKSYNVFHNSTFTILAL